MRKRAEIIVIIVLMIAAAAAGPQTARYVMNMKAEAGPVCIVLDPGHGAGQMRSDKEQGSLLSGNRRQRPLFSVRREGEQGILDKPSCVCW